MDASGSQGAGAHPGLRWGAPRGEQPLTLHERVLGQWEKAAVPQLKAPCRTPRPNEDSNAA